MDDKTAWAWAVITSVVLVAIGSVLIAMIVTTHATTLRQRDYNNQQMLKCIGQPERSAADCRLIIHGGY